MLKPHCWVFVSVGFTSASVLSDHICEQYLLKKKICILVDLQQLKFFVQDQLFIFLTCWAYWLDEQSLDFFKPLETILWYACGRWLISKVASWMPMAATKVSWVVCCGERDPWWLNFSTLSSFRSALLLLLCVLGICFILFDRELPLPKKKVGNPWD